MTDEALDYAHALDLELRALAARHGLDEPFFGAYSLRSAAATRDYRVGSRPLVEARVVDWRHPLAAGYYTDPGERFALDAPGYAPVAGVVSRRAGLTVANRAVAVATVQTPSGTVRLVAGPEGFAAPEGRPARASGAQLGDLRAYLSPAQHRLIASSRAQPLIVQGRAGSGKTSVALHRVAWLAFADEAADQPPVDPARVLIVMYNRALAGFVRGLLGPLGLERAQLDTFHGWALAAVQRGYNGKLQLDVEPAEGDEEAAAAKKHVGMLAAIDALVTEQTRTADAYLAAKLAPYAETGLAWLARWREGAGPLVRRLMRCRAEALVARDGAKGVVSQRLTEIHKVFAAAVTRVTLYKDELRRMLTDVPLLSKHLRGLPLAHIEALAANQRALSARGGSGGHPGHSVRFDDLALILRLMQAKNGGLPDKRDDSVSTFEHLVIDEAQDFGAVELAVLLGAVRSRTGVTIVGDLNQKIVPSADFVGWASLARELGVSGVEVCALTVAHRATGPIIDLADHVIDEAPSGGRAGQAPRLLRPLDAASAVDAIAEEVFAVLADDPRAHIALVTRRRGEVGPLVTALSAALDGLCAVREGHNKDFTFAPGLTVTNYRQVKGLEFDAVIVHEPTEAAYPATEQGRRDLYTVLTRARDRLVLVSVEPPTRLLLSAADAGLIDVPDADQVPPAELGALDEPL